MPFRPVDIQVTYGKPELLVRAGPDDAEIQVSSATFGASGVAGGPNYVVGLKQRNGSVLGLFRTANEFQTDLSAGDELWVAAAEELAFTTTIRITGLIRTRPASEDDGDTDRDG